MREILDDIGLEYTEEKGEAAFYIQNLISKLRMSMAKRIQ